VVSFHGCFAVAVQYFVQALLLSAFGGVVTCGVRVPKFTAVKNFLFREIS